MKKFLFSASLLLFAGYAMAQTAKIDTGFVGNPCDLPVTVNLTNSSTPQGTITSTEWTVKEPSGSTILNNKGNGINSPQTFIFTQPGTYTVIMCVDWGIAGTDCDTVQIAVGALIPNYIVDNPRICSLPDTICVMCLDATMSYQWEIIPHLQGKTMSNSRTDCFAIASTETRGTRNLVLTVTDRWNGCSASDTTALYIYDTVLVSADFTSDGHEYPCPDPDGMPGAGRTVQFINLSQGNIVQSTWYFKDRNATSIIYANNAAHTYKDAGKYDITLIVTDINGCTDTKTEQDYINVQGARGTFSYKEMNDCMPLTVEFQPNVDSTDNNSYLPDSILILTMDGNLLINGGDYFDLNKTIIYDYTFGSAYLPIYLMYKQVFFNGKWEACLVQINEIDTIYVVDLKPDFDTIVSYYPGMPINIINQSNWIPNYLPYDSVIWKFDNGDISYDFNATSPYNALGTHRIELTMKVLNCVKSKKMDIQIVGGVGIVSTASLPLPQIYPNPTNGQLKIKNHELRKNTVIEFFDVVGQVVGTYRIRTENNEAIIDINHLANGMYFLKVDGKVYKIVKQ
jgi:PKD repeat protein